MLRAAVTTTRTSSRRTPVSRALRAFRRPRCRPVAAVPAVRGAASVVEDTSGSRDG
jgi:hypothetical protein